MIVEAKSIDAHTLGRIADGEATALRIPGYFDAHTSAELAKQLLGSDLHGRYENAEHIGRVGQAYFETVANEEAKVRYTKNSIGWIQKLRRNAGPLLTPVDRVRLELDEVWQAGAGVATLEGNKMFVGLARVFEQGSYAEPHQDVLAWDAAGSADAARLRCQIAMNVYLTLPEGGGELTLWDCSYDQDGYRSRQVPGSYGLRRETLPQPVAQITPRVGELIFFKANNVHAVELITAGKRVTWSCFVGFEAHDRPLRLWS